MPRWIYVIPLLLSACAGGPELETEAAEAALAAHRASLQALGTLAPVRSTTPRPPAAPAQAAGGAEAAPANGTTPPAQASSLLGASPEAVLAALGEPLLRREEGPAQVWLYTGGGCQLDIVLYPAEAGPRVAHVQARAGGITQRTEASCLRDLAAGGSSRAAPPRVPPRRAVAPSGGPSSLGAAPSGEIEA